MQLMTVVGARPQFVKAAAVSRAIARARVDGIDCEESIVHTGQHYDERMSAVFFDELGIPPPAISLEVGSGAHGAQTGEMMRRLEPVMIDRTPDVVLVYGDTNSTLAAAVVAAKLHIPLVHVEAGLRSFNRDMPEEINRVLTDHVADLLLCPSQTAVDHLGHEGVTDGVHMVGDVMYDVLLDEVAKLPQHNAVADQLGVVQPLVLVTLHRPSNVDDPQRLGALVESLTALRDKGFAVVWPVHPRVADSLDDQQRSRFTCTTPLAYAEMLLMLRDAAAVVTDSGGLQKEAYWMGTPCFTLRDETEWTETVDAGWNQILGKHPEQLADAVNTTLAKPPADRPPVYGDGHAAELSVRTIWDRFA